MSVQKFSMPRLWCFSMSILCMQLHINVEINEKHWLDLKLCNFSGVTPGLLVVACPQDSKSAPQSSERNV